MQKHHNHQTNHKEKNHNHNHHMHSEMKTSKKRFALQIFIVVLYFYFIAISIIKPNGVISYTWNPYIWFPITTFVVFFEGINYFKAYKDLMKLKYGMNTLVAFSAHILYLYSSINSIINIGADPYTYSVMWEGVGMLIIFVQFGEQIMGQIMQKATAYEESLKSTRDKEIKVLRVNKELKVKACHIEVNDIILVRHGDLVVVDGIALEDGIFNYQNITGESKHINIKKNKAILSGSYNSGDTTKMKVTKKFEDSYINKIIEAIGRFSKIRPQSQIFADKILKYFVPTIFSIAILTFITLFILSQTTHLTFPWDTASGGKLNAFQALSSSIAVIAIACPCAIGMATPLIYAITSIIGSRNGIVINNPRAIENISESKVIAFDKTGTITSSEMALANFKGDKSFIPLAKALEKNINHPIAKAITSLKGKIATGVTDIKIKNNGIVGKFQNQQIAIKTIPGNNTYTNLGFFVENHLKFALDLENKIKDNVKKTISYFNKEKLETILISGDNKNVCLDVGKKIAINKIYYEKKSLEKTNIINDFQKQNKEVTFVGDGFNDSPAMKKANTSISFASGSDITNSLSDIVLINNEFSTIKKVFKLSKINNKRIRLSLFYAFLFNIIALPLVILGFLQPWLAAIIMSLSNILVGLNGIWYLRFGMRKIKK